MEAAIPFAPFKLLVKETMKHWTVAIHELSNNVFLQYKSGGRACRARRREVLVIGFAAEIGVG